MKNHNLKYSTGVQKRIHPLIYHSRLGGPFLKAHHVKGLDNGDNVVVTGWGRTSNNFRRELTLLIRRNVAKKELQYLKTKTANNLCKEKISQDLDTTKVLCAGGDKGE